jgi:hypothetical protein
VEEEEVEARRDRENHKYSDELVPESSKYELTN